MVSSKELLDHFLNRISTLALICLTPGFADDWIWVGGDISGLSGETCSNVVASKSCTSLSFQVGIVLDLEQTVCTNILTAV